MHRTDERARRGLSRGDAAGELYQIRYVDTTRPAVQIANVTPDDLETRFARLRQDLRDDLRADIAASIAESRRQSDEALAETRRQADEALAESRAESRRYTEEMVAKIRAESRQYTEASVAESRRFFQVIAEDLVSRIQLVAEGVTAVDQKLDRFREEVRGEFAIVNRRLLRLDARVSARRGRS